MELSSSLPGPPGTNCHPLLYWDNSLITGKFEDVWLRKCQVQHLRFCALVQTRNVAVFMVNKESYMCWWVKDCRNKKICVMSIEVYNLGKIPRCLGRGFHKMRRDISMSVHNVLQTHFMRSILLLEIFLISRNVLGNSPGVGVRIPTY